MCKFSFSELWNETFFYCVEFITMTTSEEYSPLNEQPVNNYLSGLVQGTDNGIVDEKGGFEITPGQVKVPKTHNVSLWHLFGQHLLYLHLRWPPILNIEISSRTTTFYTKMR